MTQDIGTRMKSYESNRRLTDGAVIIRVDGKAFHTWTSQVGAVKPFDPAVMYAMTKATIFTSESMQGFKLAYTQSDESTFLITNIDKQQQWFGGKLDKIVSIAASTFTYWFNKSMEYWVNFKGYQRVPAFFDARTFNIPIEDAANNFYWRQLDWVRNSVVMLGRAHFSHKQLQNKSTTDVKQMLNEAGHSWDALASYEKYGRFVLTDRTVISDRMSYSDINELAGINAT